MGISSKVRNMTTLSGLKLGRHFVMQGPPLNSTVLRDILPSGRGEVPFDH